MRPFFSAVTRILSILFVVVLILACVGPILGGALYLQRYGIVTEGQVVDKEESINSTARNNNWTRRLQITVSYIPRDQTYPNEAVIGVDRPTFDRLIVGSTVAVRYQPEPWMRYQPLSGVLLAEQTPWSLFSSFTSAAGATSGQASHAAAATAAMRVLRNKIMRNLRKGYM